MPDASLASGSQQAQCSPCHWHQGQGLNLRVRRFHTPICNAAVEDWYATSCCQNDHCLSDWIGLYTSPHLVAVRERIRINGKPIAEEDFARYFFEVWDRLERNDVVGQFSFSYMEQSLSDLRRGNTKAPLRSQCTSKW